MAGSGGGRYTRKIAGGGGNIVAGCSGYKVAVAADI